MDTYGTMLIQSNLESIAVRLLRCSHMFWVGRIECLFGDGCWNMKKNCHRNSTVKLPVEPGMPVNCFGRHVEGVVT